MSAEQVWGESTGGPVEEAGINGKEAPSTLWDVLGENPLKRKLNQVCPKFPKPETFQASTLTSMSSVTNPPQYFLVLYE